jgi:hypothetical protein
MKKGNKIKLFYILKKLNCIYQCNVYSVFAQFSQNNNAVDYNFKIGTCIYVFNNFENNLWILFESQMSRIWVKIESAQILL